MKQALVVINEIRADNLAIQKTISPYLKNDRVKHIRALKRELKEYCMYKNFDYKKLCEEYNI